VKDPDFVGYWCLVIHRLDPAAHPPGPSQEPWRILRWRSRNLAYREDWGGGVTLTQMRIPGGTFLIGAQEGEGPRELDLDSEYCRRLRIPTGKNYCLPSDAPWDYACRPDHFILLTTPHLPAKLRNSGT
jgi:formylglycine-generating enzyme required for sulfatase activity